MNKLLSLLVPLLIMASFSVAAAAGSLSVSVTSQRYTMDVGQSTLLTASVAGGDGNYACQWSYYSLFKADSPIYLSSNSCSVLFFGNSSTFSESPDVITANANDTSGNTGSGQTIVSLYYALALSITPSSNVIYVGNTITITNSTANGSVQFTGSPPYSYYYVINPLLGVNQSGNSFHFTKAGLYNITEIVNDTNGASVAASALITVQPIGQTLTVSISAPRSTIELGQNTTLSAKASGGKSPYTYGWFVNGEQNSTSTSNTFLFIPAVPSVYSIHANVTDVNANSNSSANLSIAVVSPPSIVLSPPAPTITAGQSVTFTNVISDGIGPYSYSYNTPVGVLQKGNSFAFPIAGNYVITETVIDSYGFAASSSAQVSVGVPPAPYAQIYVNGTKFDLGQTVLISGSVTNLIGPYTYNLIVLNKLKNKFVYGKLFGSIPTNSYQMSYKTTLQGAFYAKVSVANAVASATSPNSNKFIVYPKFSIVPIYPGKSEIIQGQSIKLSAGARGGSGIYSYQWFVKGPNSIAFVPIPGATRSYYTFTSNSQTLKGSTYLFTFNATDIGISNPITLSDQQASITVANTVKSGKHPCLGSN